MRIISWWSAGAASAVATHLALQDFPELEIYYCDTGAEHEDNVRFRADCESWYGKPIVVLRSERYADTWDVFERTRYLVGVNGARCTAELKKLVRRKLACDHVPQVFGFHVGEERRARKFCANEPEIELLTPLITRKHTKRDCLAALARQGIEVPKMYQMGYKNNNCIGCVKGQAGYWNKIRKDFPEIFERMAKMERELNVAICKTERGGKRQRVFLDELDPCHGRYQTENISCGITCDS